MDGNGEEPATVLQQIDLGAVEITEVDEFSVWLMVEGWDGRQVDKKKLAACLIKFYKEQR